MLAHSHACPGGVEMGERGCTFSRNRAYSMAYSASLFPSAEGKDMRGTACMSMLNIAIQEDCQLMTHCHTCQWLEVHAAASCVLVFHKLLRMSPLLQAVESEVFSKPLQCYIIPVIKPHKMCCAVLCCMEICCDVLYYVQCYVPL